MSTPTARPRPLVVRSDEAEFLASIGHRLLADSSTTGGVLSTHRVTLDPGGDGAVPHRHEGSSEMFFVVDGAVQVLVDDDVVTAGAGDVVLVPPGVPHAFGAAPRRPVDMLIVLTPGIERFDYFRHVVRQRAGLQSPEVLAGLQGRFDTHFVTSPAWRAARNAS